MPRMLGKAFRRIAALVHRRRLQRELVEEMAAHREMMSVERRPHFGSTLQLQEEAGDHWGWTWLDHFQQDLQYGARSLRRSPGFALTAIAVLSLGIGANLAEFHLFNAFLHRLDVRNVDTLGQFFRMSRRPATAEFSLPEIEFYRRGNTVLSAVLSETDLRDVCQGQDPAPLRCILVSGNFFSELGIAPLYGRLLNELDDRPGAAPAVVLGYDHWRNRFGADPEIVGKTIRLNDRPMQVVGVAPSSFGGLGKHAAVWLTIAQEAYLTGDASAAADLGRRRTLFYGRLKPGISFVAAQEQIRSLTDELRREQPRYFPSDEWLKVEAPGYAPNLSAAMVLLVSTCVLLVLLVLFSACANLGNMLLARGLARRREIEIRLAVGAGRWRLIRQLMTENLLLAAVASVAAVFVGRAAAVILLRVSDAPSSMRVITDWRILSGAAALGLGATLAFGLAPALQVVRRGATATRARRFLVAVQVSASCVLLILSSFFMRAIQQALHGELAFDSASLAVVNPGLQGHGYPSSQARRAIAQVSANLRRLPGIDGVSPVTCPPMKRSCVERIPEAELYVNAVDPAYFPMMRLSPLAGRLFTTTDPDAVVVSQSTARKLWPGQSPLGQTIAVSGRPRTVLGVVADSGVNSWSNPGSVEIYTPIAEADLRDVTILVHASTKPATMSGAMLTAASLPGLVPSVFAVQSLVDLQWDSTRKMVTVVGSLAAIASLLALLGIFGLLAFTVAQRTREIGVRMALGARKRDVLQVVLGQYGVSFGMGTAAGLCLAAATVKVIRSSVFGFIPFDALSFGAGLLLFAAVALAGAIAPVRRALRIDPASALRYE